MDNMDPLRIRRRHVREALNRHLSLLLASQDEDGEFYPSFLTEIRDEMRAGVRFAVALDAALDHPEFDEFDEIGD